MPPCVSAETTPLPSLAAPPAALRQGVRTILLAEDNEFVAGLVTRILERQEWIVLRASNGAACERLLVEHAAAVALVIADVRLPDVAGQALCRELRRRSPGLRVLLTSGNRQCESDAIFREPGVSFLAKPFLPAELERRVERALRTTA